MIVYYQPKYHFGYSGGSIWNESNQTLFPTALRGIFWRRGKPSQDVSIDIWLMDDAYSLATTEVSWNVKHTCVTS